MLFDSIKKMVSLRSPSVRHLSSITFAMGLIALSNFAIMKIVAERFGPDPFGEFMLVKRNAAWLQGPLLLGIGVALPRFLAIAKEKRDSHSGATIVLGMNLLVLAISMVPLLFALSLPGREAIASLLFGSSAYASLIIPLVTYNLTLILSLTIATYLQGISSLSQFSAFNSVNMAVVPLTVVAVFKTTDVRTLFFALSAACSILPLSLMSVWFFRNVHNIKWKKMFSITKPVLLYGCSRMPGDLALGWLMALPALVTVHLTSIRWGGATSFGLSLLQLGGTLFSPLGVLFLPKMSILTTRGAKDDILRLCQKSLILTFVLATVLTLALLVAINWVIYYGLGNDFFFGKGAIVSVLFASLPYSLYVVMRGILDGLAVRAFNTENVFYGLIAFCVLGLGLPFALGMKDHAVIAMTIGAAFSCSLTLIAGLSLWRLRQVIARIEPHPPEEQSPLTFQNV